MMKHTALILLVGLFLAGCSRTHTSQEAVVPLTSGDNPLVSVTMGGPVCDNVPEPECAMEHARSVSEYNGCISQCSPTGICESPDIDPDDPEPDLSDLFDCLNCQGRCGQSPGPMNCPTVSIRAECTDCADDLVESVKTCKIPNILPPHEPRLIDIVVPCEQDWSEVGECGECGPQTDDVRFGAGEEGLVGYFPAKIGRKHCTCPSPTGSSWTSICRVPYAPPKFVRD